MAGRTPRRPELRLRWRARRLTRPLLLVVMPAAAALAGLYWYAMSGRYVATDNAYVKADIVAISPDVDGRVIAVEVAENQLVQQGDLLFRLDPEPYQIALDMAEAKLRAVRNDVEASRAEFHQIEAEIGEALERVRFYAHQAARQHRDRGPQGGGRGRAAGGQATGGRAAAESAHRARGAGR
jgi:membrane fusion protein (multidrug efflux system)